MKHYIPTLIMALVTTAAVAQQQVQKATPKTGGGAAAASYAATGKAVKPADTAAVGKQTQGTSFGEKVSQGIATAARPGTPIGGIIVKGGKNSEGAQMVVTADSSGQFELTIKEAGNYRFIITAPESQKKGHSEKGIKRSENPLYTSSGQAADNPLAKSDAFVASPGNPIGGIIVKGGKNPGGSMIVITTNKDGELILNGLEAGTYRFVVTAP